MNGRPRLVSVLVPAAVVAAAAVAVAAIWTQGGDPPPAAPAAEVDACRGLTDDGARSCYTREFLARVEGRRDPRPVVKEIADSAWRRGGFLLSNCHGVMHTVGRTYAREKGVTLSTLMNYLPRNNDPSCSAGFAHGLVTAVAPLIDPRRPRAAAAVCGDARTRYQRYSCIHGFGHAFMRINSDRLGPALHLCHALGPRADADCAQGAYHDYWFAVAGADDAMLTEKAVKDPRELCAAQPAAYVRPCWYRAFIDNRPSAFAVQAPEDVDALCHDLRALQRQACVTAASVIGPSDPALQLELCKGLRVASDAANCVRGTKVQNVLGAPATQYVRLIERCDGFAVAARGACYRWLGKVLAVVTDGGFARTGCPKLADVGARRECRAGARTIDDALVTFS